jgi:hypothetical protein
MRASLRRLVAFTGLFGVATLVADVTVIPPDVIVAAPAADVVPQLVIATPPALDAITFAAMNEGLDLGTSKLHGNVTFDVPVTAGSDVILAPGNSPGTLTFNAGLTLAPGGSLDFEVANATGSAGSGYDLVRISGGSLDITATSASPFTIRVLSLTPAGTPGDAFNFSSSNGYSWMLYQGNPTGTITGFDPAKFVLDLSGFTNPVGASVFILTQGTTGAGDPAIFLNFTAVPEPSTYALMALGLGAAVVVRRRRR